MPLSMMPIRMPRPVFGAAAPSPGAEPAPDQTDGAPVSWVAYALTRSLRAIGCTARMPGSARRAGSSAAGTVTARPVSRAWVR